MKTYNMEQGSMEWHEIRLGKVTSTLLKKVLGDSNLDAIDELIAEIEVGQSDDNDFVSEDMMRGTDLEPIAASEYEKEKGYTTTQCGFATSDLFPLLGVSPDRWVGETGAVEIKCPKTKTHIKTIRQGQIPNEHKNQVLCYFLVNEKLEWLDFVSFDPRLTKKPLFIHRITREDLSDEIQVATAKLHKFFAKFEKLKTELFF